MTVHTLITCLARQQMGDEPNQCSGKKETMTKYNDTAAYRSAGGMYGGQHQCCGVYCHNSRRSWCLNAIRSIASNVYQGK